MPGNLKNASDPLIGVHDFDVHAVTELVLEKQQHPQRRTVDVVAFLHVDYAARDPICVGIGCSELLVLTGEPTVLKAIKETSPRVQVILETATEAVRAGAFDYVAKPIGKAKLLRAVANAATVKALDDERRRLAAENLQHRESLERLVGERTVALRASNRALAVLSECCQALARAASESSLRQGERSAGASDDPSFIYEILSAFEIAQQRAAQTAADPSAVASDPELVDTLSDRELEVVGLLSERMRDKEIAQRLFISPQTVKSHLRNIYAKLDARDRRQAVNRAFEVGLIKPPR